MRAAEEPRTKQINKTKTIFTTERAINDDVKKNQKSCPTHLFNFNIHCNGSIPSLSNCLLA